MDSGFDAGRTHEVLNQPAALEPYNAFHSDVALKHWTGAFGGDWHNDALAAYGARAGGDLYRAGFLANKHKPEYQSHDRFGRRVDRVDYHPAYHDLMRAAIEAGHHSLPWTDPGPGAQVARAALEYLHTQADPGSGCPLTMTYASVATIRQQADIADEWLPKITSRRYDPRDVPFFEKEGLTIGMAMTEKQGGSDVRSNTTRARPLGRAGPGEAYELIGHKWFCSAPMCDAFLVLAHSEEGLSCFLLPRFRPDGSKNSMEIQRLKDKMGNCSNASSEVEYRNAFAWMIGEEGRGVPTIIEMVNLTRFDCMVGSAAIMRQAVAEAIHHTGGREAFGRNLHRQPLMQNVLADMALESEAALAIAMRIANSLDALQAAGEDRRELRFNRVATAIGKYWICKRAAQLTYEAMECIGGVGVVEDNVLPRLYREAPINAIWEGSGNIQCLDVLRAVRKDPAVLEAFLQDLESARGRYPEFDAWLDGLPGEFEDGHSLEFRSRAVVEKLALAWQAATLIVHGDAAVAEAFVTSRIARVKAQYYGTLPGSVDAPTIIERARPQL